MVCQDFWMSEDIKINGGTLVDITKGYANAPEMGDFIYLQENNKWKGYEVINQTQDGIWIRHRSSDAPARVLDPSERIYMLSELPGTTGDWLNDIVKEVEFNIRLEKL